MPDEAEKSAPTWWLQLVCCGREDGVPTFPTWEEADRFRESYVDAGGHDRAAILTGPWEAVDA